jgi:hypothetical protein
MDLNLRKQLDSLSKGCKHIKKSPVVNEHKFPCKHKFFNSQLNSCNARYEDFLDKV